MTLVVVVGGGCPCFPLISRSVARTRPAASSTHGTDPQLSPRPAQRLRPQAQACALLPLAPPLPLPARRPTPLTALVLSLAASDTVHSIKARAARKLAIPQDGADIHCKYLWCDVFYALDDGPSSLLAPGTHASVAQASSHLLLSHTDDDYEVFTSRHQHSPEVTLLLSSPHIPTQAPSIASVSSLPPSSSFSSSSLGARSRGEPDASSVYSGTGSLVYGRAAPRDLQGQTSMHLVPPSPLQPSGASGSVRSGRSARSRRSQRSMGADTLKSKRGKVDSIVPEHKVKFEEFHNQVCAHSSPSSSLLLRPSRRAPGSLSEPNGAHALLVSSRQLGVRTFIGSIGPVQNVRMMVRLGLSLHPRPVPFSKPYSRGGSADSATRPPLADEVGPPRVLHVASVCAGAQLHPARRRTGLLRVLGHHQPRDVADQGALSSAPP